MRLAMITILLGMLVPEPEVPPPRVQVETLGPDRFCLVLVGVEGDDRISQAAIAPIAAQLCPGKVPIFGEFTGARQIGKRKKGAPAPARFVQAITCGAASSVAPTARSASIVPDAALEASARAAALAFLSAYDSGQGDASWKMFSAGMQAQQPLRKWTDDARAHAAAVGPGVAQTIVKLSWYTDPPGAAPGTYVAADFVGHSDKQAFVCGYVAMVRERDTWSVVRIETGSIPHSMMTTTDPSQIARLKQEIRCVDG